MGWLKHTAELNGHKVVFYSIAKSGSVELLTDAVQACKQEGIYTKVQDYYRIRVDGQKLS